MTPETINSYLDDARTSVPGTEFTVTAEELEFLCETALKNFKEPRRTAEQTRETVRQFMLDHPGAKQAEIAKGLGLSTGTIHAAVKAIRSSWMN